MTHEQFLTALGTKPMYLKNSFEDAVLRTEPTATGLVVHVKFKGKQEFMAKKGSTVVADAYLEQALISEKEYLNF